MHEVQKQIQRGGIEPPTSAVLKPRHNQLDHLCLPLLGRALKLYTMQQFFPFPPRNSPYAAIHLLSCMHNIMHTARVCIVVRVLVHILASSRSIYTTSRLQYMNRVCIIFNTEPPQPACCDKSDIAQQQPEVRPSIETHRHTLDDSRGSISRAYSYRILRSMALRRPPTRVELKADDIAEYEEVRPPISSCDLDFLCRRLVLIRTSCILG